MGLARESYDLFNRYGRIHFWRYLRRYGRISSLTWGDTFGRFRCMVFGHDIYDSNAGGFPPEPACKKCHKFIKKCHKSIKTDTKG